MTERAMKNENIDTLFRKYRKGLVYCAQKLVGDFYADDVVADVFVHLIEIDLDDRIDMKAYLYKSVINKSRSLLKGNYNRYKKYYPLYDYDMCSDEYTDGIVIQSELVRIICDKVESLNPVRRQIFELLYLKQCPIWEVAEILNTTRTAIMSHKQRLDKDFKLFGIPLYNKKHWFYNDGIKLASARRERANNDDLH